MMRRLKTSRMVFAVVAATALAGVGVGPSGLVATAATDSGELTSDAPITVVASGLNSPRSLAWGPDGHMLVAEMGSPTLTPPSECNFNTGVITFDMACFGFTGSISDISSGTPVRIVTGLLSSLNGGNLIGPNDLKYVDGHLYTVLAGSPQGIPSWVSKDLRKPLKENAGALLDVTSGSIVANPGKVDNQWVEEHLSLSPFLFGHANPHALIPKPGGGFYLVDAAANTLDSVDQRGKVRVLALIPPTAAGGDAVPACLDLGPDGAVYIGAFTGFRSSGTAANVYRYEPSSGELTVWQSGFSAITGCGFGANGDFYVTEYSTTGFPPANLYPDGQVIQISKEDGTRTVLGAGILFGPTGFLAAPDGSIYVANKTVWWPPGTSGQWNEGEVVKIG